MPGRPEGAPTEGALSFREGFAATVSNVIGRPEISPQESHFLWCPEAHSHGEQLGQEPQL